MPSNSSWFPLLKPNSGALLRLFCFPYSGAGASAFYAWPNSLPSDIEVCPIQLPGREIRLAEPPFTSLAPLVHTLAHVILVGLDKPFAFFGHSMGALVSFEVARHLRRRYGLRPAHLFVSGYGAPHIARRDQPISSLPEPEFLAKLRHLNGTPEDVLEHAELRDIILPILRADFAVCETYVYETDDPLDCPISAFGGLEDYEVSRDQLEAWREQTSSSFSVRMFPGDHFYLNTARPLVLRILAQELSQIVSKIAAETKV